MNKKLKALLRILPEGKAPEWIEIIPAGPEIVCRDKRKYKNLAPEGIVTAFKENDAFLPVDYEHSSELRAPEGLSAPAVGWIVEMEVRQGSIWAKIDWTEEGAAAVASKSYRYISPAFWADSRNGSITSIDSIALTNNPAMRLNAIASKNKQENTQMLKAIASALGLKEGATETEILNAVALKNADIEKHKASAVKPDVEKFVARSEYETLIQTCSGLRGEIKELKDAEKTKATASAVDKAIADGKVPPATRDSEIEYCDVVGVEKYTTRLKNMTVIASNKEDENLNNPEIKDGKLTDDQKVMCRSMNIKEKDYVETLKLQAA